MARTIKRSGFGFGRLMINAIVLLVGLAVGYWLGFSRPEWMGIHGRSETAGKPVTTSLASARANATRLEKENTRLRAELQRAQEELAEARIRNVLSQSPAP